MWGYGGFGISVAASYRPIFVGWLAAGGLVVLTNLRGGGEFGTAWHDAGRLERKQNVFDDFAAVGDHLVARGVTTHDRLAVHGGSNGGLLVGATLVQRPDLAAVALPAVGVLDMLRYHLFTIGAAWVPDYGSPEDPAMFEVLRAYSPLHNVVEGASYPATLVTTGDHDDRVVPAHSFKFTAALQHAQGGDAPVLARIETSTGHGLGKPSSVVVAEEPRTCWPSPRSTPGSCRRAEARASSRWPLDYQVMSRNCHCPRWVHHGQLQKPGIPW